MTEINKTPDALVVNSKITKSMLGGFDFTFVISDANGDEIARFGKSSELQHWLTYEGYVYFTGSRGVWIKAPKAPTNEKEA